MGIDIFAQWKGETDEERSEQSAYWLSTIAGSRGYLREAYHGEPYATKFLCPEAFVSGEARIPAALLQERLPQTLVLAEKRQRTLYQSAENEIKAILESYRAFVALCERKERETGEPVLIIASY